MKPTDVDVDDFLEFVGDFNSKWTDDHKGIVLHATKRKAYQVAAYLVDWRHPSLVITFQEHMTEAKRSRIYNRVRDSAQKFEASLRADVHVSWHRRDIRVTCRVPVQWPDETVSQATYARSATAAKKWYQKARRDIEHLIHQTPGHEPTLHSSEVYVTRKMMSRAPTPVPIAKPRKPRATPPSAWPIPLTPAAPFNDTQAPAAKNSSPSVETPVPLASAAGATPKGAAQSPPARRQRLCPVCDKPTSAGRVRHQQCEGRTVPGQGPKHVAPPTTFLAITPEASSEYKRLVRQVERSETAAYGKRRATSRRDPLRLSEARKAVLLRCQGHCENPACGGEPNDLTDDGRPILEVDHVQRIAEGGRDHPVQMVALCPNCHAMKERGSNRRALQAVLRDIAARSHERWNSAPS